MRGLTLSLLKLKNLKITRGFSILLSFTMFLAFSLTLVGAVSSNKTDKPTIIRIEEGAKTIKLAGVPGAVVEATFNKGVKSTATVSVAKATSLAVPEGLTLSAGDIVTFIQTQPGKEASDAVKVTVSKTPVSQGGPKTITRSATINTLYKNGDPSLPLTVGDEAYFLDTFQTDKTPYQLPYLKYDDETLVKPSVVSSGANAFVNESLFPADRDDKLLKFGEVKDAVSKNKKQSAYFAIDATMYKDLYFSIRIKQKASGTPETPAKVSVLLEYSVDGGKTYTKIREMNNRGGNTNSPLKDESGYLAHYTPENDNHKDYTASENIINKKPQSTWIKGEDAYTIKLVGADNQGDVRVRISNLIYDGVPGAEAAHAADYNAINTNYIAFDNLVIKGTYNPPPDVPPTGVSISDKSASLLQNQTVQLSASVTPINSLDKSIVWSSDNTNVATVDSNGLVTAINVGTAKISATNSYSGKIISQTATITVNTEPSSNRVIQNFTLINPSAVGIIDKTNNNIIVRVDKGTDLNNIVANFAVLFPKTSKVTVNGVLQKSGVTANDFRNPVKYNIQNISNDITTYTVTVVERELPSTPKDTYHVSNKKEIDDILKFLKPGDTVIMKNEVWNDADILFAADGLKDKPITLKAETQGKVELKGASRITLEGSFLVLDGVNFIGKSPEKLDGAVVFGMFSNNSRMTNVIIDDYNPTMAGHIKHHWVWNYGTYNRIDHNSFIRKEYEGEMLRLYKGIEHRALIDYNYFGERVKNSKFTNNLEAVQFGMYTGSGSSWETVPSNSILEHNYFYKWDGEIEIVSVKAHNVIIRYNTIEESVGTICLRISDNSQVYSNYFFQNNETDSGGIRAYGSGHLIYNNYIERPAYNGQQRAGIVLQAGAGPEIADNKTDVRVAANIMVANNTIVSGEGVGMTFGAEPSATKPKAPNNITLVNNVIINSKDKKTIMNILSPTNSNIKNNFIAPLNPEAPISGSNSLEKPIPSDFEFINKEIFYTVVNDISIPTVKSPVIGAGNVNGVDLSFLKTDIEGKTRGNKIDAGAYQLNGTGPITNKRLTIKDVGPISK